MSLIENNRPMEPDRSVEEKLTVDNNIPKKPKNKTTRGIEIKEKIRVGPEYQALLPKCIQIKDKKTIRPSEEKSLLVWQPSKYIENNDNYFEITKEYINYAKSRYNYNIDQALGMLYWHKHNHEAALKDLPNYASFANDYWSGTDQLIFEQSVMFYGNDFHKIQVMLPKKTIPSLITHYYCWKKNK